MTKRPDYRFLFLAVVWMAIIFWFSSQSTMFHLPGSLLDMIFKKSAHAAAYGVLWLLWWLATGRRPWLALALTIGYAISDEWHQTFVPGRHGRPFDVGVDTVGALLMLGLLYTRWGRARFS